MSAERPDVLLHIEQLAFLRQDEENQDTIVLTLYKTDFGMLKFLYTIGLKFGANIYI